MDELFIDIQPADECWREQYDDDDLRATIMEDTK